MGSEKVNFLGVNIDNISMKQALERAEKFIALKTPHMVCTPNIDHIMHARKDLDFLEIINSCDMAICDSLYVVWASRFLGEKMVERVAGSDFVPLFAETSAKKGYKIFLLGAEKDVARIAQKKLCNQFKDLKIVGVYSPSSADLKNGARNKKILSIIKQAKPDALFVALGAPKQEKWIKAHLQELNVPLCMGVGGTFDFLAGTKKRAPKWVQKIGLEWFYRLVQEPRRLWRRYLIEDPKFIFLVLKEKIKQVF